MRRRSRLPTPAASAALSLATATATLLAAAVTVTGCGASASQPNAALPAAGAATQASSGPPVATMPANAPKFAIPADFHVVIDADSTGNTTSDSILLDAQYQFYGFVEAISNGDSNDRNFKQWTTGGAYAGLSQSVGTWKSRGERLTGTDHIYKRTVTISSNGSQAAYSACEDSSKAYPLKIGSGQRLTNSAGTGNFTLWQGTFIKHSSGAWVLDLIFTKPGASQCVVG